MRIVKWYIIVILTAWAYEVYAHPQKQNVAVYIVGEKNEINKILGDQLVSAFARSGDYIAVERTESFLQEIGKEQAYSYSGAVNDSELSAIGKQLGVQLICVVEVSDVFNEKYISTRLIDVNTAQVIKTASAASPLKSMTDLMNVSSAIISDLLNTQQKSFDEQPYINTNRIRNDYTEQSWDIGMKMIWVEGGDFYMGCTNEQSNCDDDEKTVRHVTIDGFYIGMFEVSQSQWEKVVGTTISQQKSKAKGGKLFGTGPDYPMYYVSWDEAMEFCRLLSNKTGKTYTLPTEAQWEYAARGGNKADGTLYSGSNIADIVAWYNKNCDVSSHQCGAKRANSLGIYDMSGNVWEWCKDWYDASYDKYDLKNPQGPSTGEYRVARGGGWCCSVNYCQVAHRHAGTPDARDNVLGFRVVCIP